MPAKPAEQRTNLARAFYALDNKKKGPLGISDRARFKSLIITSCQIEGRTWYEWMSKPASVRPSDRVTLSLLFNTPIKDLFNKQLNANLHENNN
jgi:hypothetical protein